MQQIGDGKMAKFAAQSIQDLRTGAATMGRFVRKAAFVVDVECDDGSWCELDADDKAHAERLARNWVDVMGARGASCWEVIGNGNVKKKPFFTYYEDVGFIEA